MAGNCDFGAVLSILGLKMLVFHYFFPFWVGQQTGRGNRVRLWFCGFVGGEFVRTRSQQAGPLRGGGSRGPRSDGRSPDLDSVDQRPTTNKREQPVSREGAKARRGREEEGHFRQDLQEDQDCGIGSTTNHEPPTINSVVLDRLLHHCETITIEGQSFRMKDKA